MYASKPPLLLFRSPLHLVRKMSSKPPPGAIVERHGNFKQTQSIRPDFDHSKTPIPVTKQPHPDWRHGDGVPGASETTLNIPHREIDPYAPSRPMISNYRLLISGIVPRPIGFLSTVSSTNPKEEGFTENLAPFSYFQVVDHDPPMFIVGFSGRAGRPKDTCRNLKQTGECVINVVSEEMIEAVNSSSLDAPYGVSEWEVSGLHRGETSTVRAKRVQESVFSIEGKLVGEMHEFGGDDHARPGFSVASLAVVKATRFWVREDAVDEEGTHIDMNVLRPLAQLGGIGYGRIGSVFELPRGKWGDAVGEEAWLGRLSGAGKKAG